MYTAFTKNMQKFVRFELSTSRRTSLVEPSKVQESRCSEDDSETKQESSVQNEKEKEKEKDVSRLSLLDLDGLSMCLEVDQMLLKRFWIVVMLGAFFATFYGLYKTAYDYWYNPVLTSYSIVSQSSLPFPEVYICPTNYINRSYVLMNGVDLSWANYIHLANQNTTGNNNILKEKTTIWESLVPGRDPTQIDPNATPPSNIQEYFMQIGYNTEKFLQECRFRNNYFNCADAVETVFDRDYGKCFLLRVDESQTTPGVGLSLVLNINTREYPDEITPIFDGALISISRKFDPASYDKILLSPGQYTKISMSLSHLLFVSIENRGINEYCLDEEKGAKKLQVMNVTYTLEACQMDCIQLTSLQACNCSILIDARFIRKEVERNFGFCDPDRMSDCVLPLLSQVQFKEAIGKCVESCYPPCELWEHQCSVSSLKFPSEVLRQKKGYLPRLATWEIDYILVDIAYNDLHYIEMAQTPSMTFDTFVSNVGGQIGLWLGASLITLIQAFILGVSFCCAYIKRKLSPPRRE